MALIAGTAVSRLNLSSDLHPGYRLRRLRGRGSFGEVWEAETSDGSTVALKFLPCARGQAVPELRSIQVIQQLSHPHLTRTDRVWCAGGYLMVAMELADGSLADLLDVYQAEVGTALPAGHLLPLMAQAAAALDFLNNCQHAIGGQWVTIQHGDVTPNNILLFGETVKLSDFGLTTTLATRQKTHGRAGTPSFAAPEVFQGRISDRSDQYGLAICYCYLRGARLPFPDLPADFHTEYTRPAPDLDMLDPAERAPILRALAQAPQDRWFSCQDLVTELQYAVCPPADRGERSDARRHPRYEPASRVACEVLGTLGNQAWPAAVQNISAAGVRLRLTKPGCELKPGRVLELVLSNGASGLRVAVRVRLAHNRVTEDGDCEVGGAFDQPLRPEELAGLSSGDAARPRD